MTHPNQKRGPWSQSEDYQLMHLVQSNGALNWVRISQFLGTRTPKQCRERYHQNLKPSLNHDPITPEEGAVIERLVHEIGKRWAEIARRLHNRSDNAVKNWWNGSQNRRKRTDRRKANYSGHHEPRHFGDARDLHINHHPQHLQQGGHPGHHHLGDNHHQAGAHHGHYELGGPEGTSYPQPAHPHQYQHQPQLQLYPQFQQQTQQRSRTPRFLPPLSQTNRTLCPPSEGIRTYIESPLPSPSALSPGAESCDVAPSLMSDSGSCYSTSPRDSNRDPSSPVDLPPLKNLMGGGQGHGHSYHHHQRDSLSPTEVKLPGFSALATPTFTKDYRQPAPHYADEGKFSPPSPPHSQLPTAPSSPVNNLPALRQRHSSPKTAAREDREATSRIDISRLII